MGRNIYIIIAGLLAIFVALYFFKCEKPDPKEISTWDYTLNKTDDGPYGLYAFFELLETYNEDHQYVEVDEDYLRLEQYDVEDQDDIYFFAGIENHYRSADWEKLSDFVYAGNTAFISVELPAYQLIEDVLGGLRIRGDLDHQENINFQSFRDTSAEYQFATLDKKPYNFEFIFEDSLQYYSFLYIENKDYLGLEKLGYYGGNELNYIKINHGGGRFLIHTSPVVFSNISIFREAGLEYAEDVLSYLPEGNVIWDEVSKTPVVEQEVRETSPLHLINNNPPLLWAYLTFLATMLLYMIFKSKRRYPVFKAREQKKNTSLNFIDVISNIYFKQNSHIKLVEIKEKTFRHFIKDRYFIEGNFEDEKFIEKLNRKSNIEQERVKKLLRRIIYLKQKTELLDEDVINLHREIEYFYKNCL